MGPPGRIEVKVSINIDATLVPDLDSEAAVPEPEGAIAVPLPPGTG